MVQEKITEADAPTIWLGATPSGLFSNPSPSSPIFTLDALPAATLPIYPVFGQAPNMLACIPSGSVVWSWPPYVREQAIIFCPVVSFFFPLFFLA